MCAENKDEGRGGRHASLPPNCIRSYSRSARGDNIEERRALNESDETTLWAKSSTTVMPSNLVINAAITPDPAWVT